MDEPKRGRGRPPGVRNKPFLARPETTRMTPPSRVPGADYKYSDPDTIVARQLSMLDWAQQAMRNEMQRAMQSKGVSVQLADIVRLEKLSNAIVKAIEALKRSSDLADELSARMTPEQLLEAALKKIEGQDIATVNYAIKRLRAHRERIAPIDGFDKIALGERSAAQTIAELSK